jgi:hypothetical protein
MRKIIATKAVPVSPNGLTVTRLVVGESYDLPDELAKTVVEVLEAGEYAPRRTEPPPPPPGGDNGDDEGSEGGNGGPPPQDPGGDGEEGADISQLDDAALRRKIEDAGGKVGVASKRKTLENIWHSLTKKKGDK